MDEAKKITAKKTATRKVLLQVKRSEAFDMCINSMNSLSSSTTDKDRFPQASHLGWDPLLSVFKTKQKQDGKKRRYVDHCDHGSNIRGTSHSLQ